jgi:Biotin-lipoyl like
MAQQKQSTQLQNTANQLLTLPGLSNGSDLSIPGNSMKPTRPWWRRRAGIIGIVLVLLVVLGAGLLYMQLNRQPPPSYQYGPVTQGDLALTIDATGPLQSPATYNLVAATSGIIEKIDVKVGQKVTRGQVLAELDKTALQDAVNQAQATVNADQDALFNTEVSTGWVVTPAVTQAEDTLKIAQAQLATARHNLDNATLRSPHAGVVTTINGTVGGTPGAPLNGSSASGGNYFIQISGSARPNRREESLSRSSATAPMGRCRSSSRQQPSFYRLPSRQASVSSLGCTRQYAPRASIPSQLYDAPGKGTVAGHTPPPGRIPQGRASVRVAPYVSLSGLICYPLFIVSERK